jgi:hypothetical protein
MPVHARCLPLIRGDRCSAPSKKQVIFGGSLEELCEAEEQLVPTVVRSCIAEIESRGLEHEGIYRKSGTQTEVNTLKAAIQSCPEFGARVQLADYEDIHVVSGVLKHFFRELPVSLLPEDYYNEMVEVVQANSDACERSTGVRAIFKRIASTHPAHYATMHFLFHHLCKVINNRQRNLMTSRNLGVVFGPTLLRRQRDSHSPAPTADEMRAEVQHMGHMCSVVEFLLTSYDWEEV